MKFSLKHFIPISVVVVSIAACNVEGSKVGLLTNGSWKLQESITIDNIDTIDNYARLKACEKDNLLKFLPDQNLEIDEGPVKCKVNDPQTYIDGTWSLSDLDAYLTINEVEFLVREFTEKQLRILTDVKENNRTVTRELTFVKQPD